MKDHTPHDPLNMIGEAYELMLERTMDEFHKAEQVAIPKLHRMIDGAKEKAVKLEELTLDEANELASIVKRDLHHAADYIDATGKELKDWLGFEKDIIKASLLDLFTHAADNTVVELKQFKEQWLLPDEYHTGEFTGLGTLYCDKCGNSIQFKQPTKVPKCPSCGNATFKR